MIPGSRMEGGTQALPARVQNTILFIKEIVKNHSEADIYAALRESNMDPNETIQKLLNQDPFREVKRKRDRRKESMANKDSVDQQRRPDNASRGVKGPMRSDFNTRRGAYSWNAAPRNAGYRRKPSPQSINTPARFRVVRDNRFNQSTDTEMNSASHQQPLSPGELSKSITDERGLTGNSTAQKPLGRWASAQILNASGSSQSRQPNVSGNLGKEVLKESTSDSCVQTVKPTNTVQSNSVVGLYSSSTDPVHVPSPDSRAPSAVGAIKRDVGVVGVRRQSSDDSVKRPLPPGASNSQLRREHTPSESFHRSFATISKTGHLGQTVVTQSFSSSHHVGKPNQQFSGHNQKGPQPIKEWKPKSSQKSGVTSPGVIGIPPPKSAEENLKDAVDPQVSQIQDRLSLANIHETQNVIIAEHIRVPDTDRCQLTFGSFNLECDSSQNFGSNGVREKLNGEGTTVLSMSDHPTPSPSLDNVSSVNNKQVDMMDERPRNSRSDSPASSSTASSEGQRLPRKKKTSSPPPQSLDNYGEIGLVRVDDSQSYAPSPSESQPQRDPTELASFLAYDPHQAGYDIAYFRTTMEEAVQGQVIQSPQEVLSRHAGGNNSIVAASSSSTIGGVEHQLMQQHHMYAAAPHQVHFANLMPYHRQFMPQPVYVPSPPSQMAAANLIPHGYSTNNTAAAAAAVYSHPSTPNSYVLMPPGGPASHHHHHHHHPHHLKYGVQQFKSPTPTGFGNFAVNHPTGGGGYAAAVNPYLHPSGVVGSVMDDSSRIKYKDGNLYLSNPQAEASEMWIQNPRDIAGMQTAAPYYNMMGQTTPHTAYLPSHHHHHHASFNAAAQSSHMQFAGGLYPPQPPNVQHHLGPANAMGGVGVAAAAAAQVGAYHQQPQLGGQFNWTTNF